MFKIYFGNAADQPHNSAQHNTTSFLTLQKKRAFLFLQSQLTRQYFYYALHNGSNLLMLNVVRQKPTHLFANSKKCGGGDLTNKPQLDPHQSPTSPAYDLFQCAQ